VTTNLKEAVGKHSSPRTETVYKARHGGWCRKRDKSPILYRTMLCKYRGYMNGKRIALPWEIWWQSGGGASEYQCGNGSQNKEWLQGAIRSQPRSY